MASLITIPARQGKAITLRRGQHVKVINTGDDETVDTDPSVVSDGKQTQAEYAALGGCSAGQFIGQPSRPTAGCGPFI